METQILTALGPNDPDDGQAGRLQRGMAIAALVPIEKNRLGYKVPSQSGNGSYVVTVDDEPFCTCPDFERRQQPCKHLYAVEFTIQREERPDGTTGVETKAVRITYRTELARLQRSANPRAGAFRDPAAGVVRHRSPTAPRQGTSTLAPVRHAVLRRPQGLFHYVRQAGNDRLPGRSIQGVVRQDTLFYQHLPLPRRPGPRSSVEVPH